MPLRFFLRRWRELLELETVSYMREHNQLSILLLGGIFITVTVVLILWITKFWLRKLRMWCPIGNKAQKYTASADDLETGSDMRQTAVAPFSASPSKYAKRMPRIAKSGKYMRGGVIGGK